MTGISIRVNVTVPKSILDNSQVVAALKDLLKNTTGPDIKEMFEGTTEGWETRPDFNQNLRFTADSLAVRVYPIGKAGKVYSLVNNGSPAHVIAVRRTSTLRFQPGYRAATTPRVLSSRAKSRFGSYVTPLAVFHPGFEGRKFDETIGGRYQSVFEHDVQEVFKRSGPLF